jgi:hypothetical protein
MVDPKATWVHSQVLTFSRITTLKSMGSVHKTGLRENPVLSPRSSRPGAPVAVIPKGDCGRSTLASRK